MGITIGSFNILDPQFAKTHNTLPGHSWQQRHPLMMQFLQQANLDVVCLQEISLQSLFDLQPSLQAQGYAIEHIKHAGRIDGLAIVYKTAKVTKKAFKSFSKYGLDSCYMDLQDTVGKVYRIANCHLKGGPQGPREGYEQLQQLQQAVDRNDDPAIFARVIVGDFNEDQKGLSQAGSKLSILQNAGYQFDGNTSVTEPSNNRRIDWIWVKAPQLQLMPTYVSPPPQPISDHLITATHIHIPTSQPPVSSSTSFSHNQPVGSFREGIMRHFTITVPNWDHFIHRAIKTQLDAILTAHKDDKPFLDAIKRDFTQTVAPAASQEEKNRLEQDLLSAIKAAQVERQPSTPTQPKTPTPVSTSTKTPLPSASAPRRTSFFSSAIKKIKSIFARFLSFFKRLFFRRT